MSSELRGTSSSERTLDQRDLASLRPAAPPRARRKPGKPVLREVTSGIVCYCGERFSETQALEFMLHLRAEMGEVLSQARNRRDKARIRAREVRRQLLDDARTCACGCGQKVGGAPGNLALYRPGHGSRVEREPAQCGTKSGANRHRRLGEPRCDACIDAERAANREYHRRKRAGEQPPPRKNLARHGTETGYQKHIRQKDPVCQGCRDAHREYRHQLRLSKRSGA